MKKLLTLCVATLFFAHTATSFAECGCKKGKGKGKGQKFSELIAENSLNSK